MHPFTIPGEIPPSSHEFNPIIVSGECDEVDIKYTVKIGRDVKEPHDPVDLKIPCNPSEERTLRGGLFVAGEPGVGKTSLSIHIVASIINSREFLSSKDRMLIIDSDGEWTRKLTERNWKARHLKFGVDPFMINNIIRPNYHVSDFSDPIEWVFLGLSETSTGPAIMARLAEEGKQYHQDDPEILYQMLGELPTDRDLLQDWNDKYSKIRFEREIHPSTANAMAQRFFTLKDHFRRPEDRSSPYVIDWIRELRKRKVLIVSIPIKMQGYKSWPWEYAALILQKILIQLDTIDRLNLFLVVEEADYLINNADKSGSALASSAQIEHMVLKRRKKGFFVMAICQLPSNLNQGVMKQATNYLHSTLPNDEMKLILGRSQSLPVIRPNQLARNRMFRYVSKLSNEECSFEPVDAAVNVND